MATNKQYQKIVEEMETGSFKKETWIRAIDKSNGTHSSASKNYISLRAEELYLEETPRYRRVLNSWVAIFNPQSRRGLVIISGTILVGLFLCLALVQPALRNNARAGYQKLSRDAQTIIGLSHVQLVEKLGTPKYIDMTDSALIYVYNPSSPFCFEKKRYNFKVFVDTRTVRVIGWEENPALRDNLAMR